MAYDSDEEAEDQRRYLLKSQRMALSKSFKDEELIDKKREFERKLLDHENYEGQRILDGLSDSRNK